MHTASPIRPSAPDATSGATLPHPLQGCTHFRLRQLMRVVGQHYDSAMAQCGLKTTQYSLLSNVLNRGPIRPGELAAAMHMEASTLTRNLRPLIDAGWVTLEAGPDARSRLVHITEAGRAKRVEAQRCWKGAQLSMNARLGVERVAALHALVDEALQMLAAEQKTEQETGHE